jgi:hypothetical protein
MTESDQSGERPAEGQDAQPGPEAAEAQRAEWVAYKKRQAERIRDHGYAARWSSHDGEWLEIAYREPALPGQSVLHASVKFFMEPSEYGIDGGRVSKLMVRRHRSDLLAEVLGQPRRPAAILYSYDRGLDTDDLDDDRAARNFFQAILDVLN